ncbi:MAG: PQQ-binding-like beta-propeller repeat protein [Bacteroidota bacterium]
MKIQILLVIMMAIGLVTCTETLEDMDWSHYLGDAHSTQYCEAKEINRSNVSQLRQVWTFDGRGAHPDNRSQIQCNPLVIDGIMYGTTAKLELVALDATVGELLWRFDPNDGRYELFGMGVNRGLAWHSSADGARILYSVGAKLFAIDPDKGEPISSFGKDGAIDLHQGLGEDAQDLFIVSNTPGIIYQDLIIMGSRVSESTGAAPGHIRAFDVHSGESRWIFRTIPLPGEYGYDTWPKEAYLNSGGANAWAGMSLDHDRGVVYVPTGSASYDFYGGDRIGDNLFANCIIALDAATGERLWHFQTIHHDLWDKDVPAPPNLVKVRKDGQEIDAIAQITKNGLVYVLDRDTGEPIYAVDEIEVSKSTLEGEKAAETQPWPTVYPPFTRTHLTEADFPTRSEEARVYAEQVFANTAYASPYEPPSEQGTVFFPGLDGGGEWGGAAYDPQTNDLIINSNELPWRIVMNRVGEVSPGQGLYATYCMGCHGADFAGNQMFGNVPSLQNLKFSQTLAEVVAIVHQGQGVMPAFPRLSESRVKAIYEYIVGEESTASTTTNDDWPYPYRMQGYEKLYAPDGYPIISPPWGHLTSYDLDEAKINWQVPLGEHEELSSQGIPITGTENYGGPVVTAGGLIFIAATMDERIRAFDKSTGALLWEHPLPAAGYATPSSYVIDGRQYIVIACGGGKLDTKSGDQYIAFAL